MTFIHLILSLEGLYSSFKHSSRGRELWTLFLERTQLLYLTCTSAVPELRIFVLILVFLAIVIINLALHLTIKW